MMIVRLCLRESELGCGGPLAGPDPQWAFAFGIILFIMLVVVTGV